MKSRVRQISVNAGVDGSVVVENDQALQEGRLTATTPPSLTSTACMTDRGIIDPTKVTRSALQNAATVAAMVLTTESLWFDRHSRSRARGSRARLQAEWAACTKKNA